jgi:hypothetical protein
VAGGAEGGPGGPLHAGNAIKSQEPGRASVEVFTLKNK